MNTETLREKALLVNLSISVWNPKRTDKTATLETLLKHNTSKNAGAFIKNILPDGAVDRVKKAEGRIRNYVYAETLPWLDNGVRLLPSALWFDFTAKMTELKDEFNQAVGEFLLEYDAHRERAKIALNGLYRDTDYPPVEEVRGKFGVRVLQMPIPAKDDFRVDMPEEAKAEIEQTLADATMDSLNGAKEAIYERLAKSLGAVVERLADPEAIFRDSLIGNVKGIVEKIPKLNVMGDTGILELAAEAEKVAKLDPESIRNSTDTREEARKSAADVLARMGRNF